MLQIDDQLPALQMWDEQGKAFDFGSLKGKNVVVFFYPKADTPGCTKEACEFRDANEKFTVANTVLVGVSPDGEKAQTKFKQKFDLPFTLVADTDHQVAEAFGVWGEKTFMGRKYMGVSRSTFVADGTGKVVHVFPKVTPEGHAAEVYAVLQGLGKK